MASIKGEEKVNEKVYVAVSKKWKACKSSLEWVFQNAKGKKLCLVHVHQPAEYICILGGKFPISSLSEQEVMIHRERERQDMCKILDEYVRMCTKAQVQVEKLHIEMQSIESGLVELISRHKIQKLVMGAAADNRYSRKMTEPKSKKAKYVREHAPAFCHIWFTCKGHLIYTRESVKQSYLNHEDVCRKEYARLRSTWFDSQLSTSTSVDSEGSCDDLNRSSTFSSRLSIGSRSSEATSDSTLYFSATEAEEPSYQSLILPPSNVMAAGTRDDALHYELDQAIAEAELAKQEAFEESIRRHQAEKIATDAISKANTVESLYSEELRRREELEKELAKAKEIVERIKEERDMALDELRTAVDQNLLLKSRAEKSDIIGKELEEKLKSSWELLQKFRKL